MKEKQSTWSKVPSRVLAVAEMIIGIGYTLIVPLPHYVMSRETNISNTFLTG